MDNNTTPDISVIIPTYNVARYIERTINSALSQQNVTLEIIMVDDCSTDDTVTTAERITDPRLTIIRQQQNGGPSISRNIGISAAKGKWIAILDGDDTLADNRLSNCLKLAAATDADIVVDNLSIFHEDSGKTSTMFNLPEFKSSKQITLTDFIQGNQSFLGGHTLGYLKPLFRKDFLQKHNLTYLPDIRIGEDYLLMAEALACGAKCIPQTSAGYIYTVRSGSISHRLNKDAIDRIEKADAYFCNKYKLTGSAKSAQDKRTYKLHQAFAFTELIDALKSRNLIKAIKTGLSFPSALAYLRYPVIALCKRTFGIK